MEKTGVLTGKENRSHYIGLYYPWIRFYDDAWVKLATLYWDKLGRIVPPSSDDYYRPLDSDTVRQLIDELGFIENFKPSNDDIEAVTRMFVALLRRHRNTLIEEYSLALQTDWLKDPANVILVRNAYADWAQILVHGSNPSRKLTRNHDIPKFDPSSEFDPSSAYISADLSYFLYEELHSMGLAEQVIDEQSAREWVALHPTLAFIYMEALASQMASVRQFYPVTDNIRDHLAASGYTLERLTQALLPSNDNLPHLARASLESYEIGQQMATIALRSILPHDIASLPIKKIIQLRRQHRTELTTFQTHIHDFVASMGKLQEINDPGALKAHLEVEYEKTLKPELEDLRKCLKSLAIDTVTGIMNVRVMLPALITSVGSLMHLAPINPIVAGTGAVVFSAFPVIREKQKEAKQEMLSSPAAYLLYVQEGLEPATIASQVAQYARRFILGT